MPKNTNNAKNATTTTTAAATEVAATTAATRKFTKQPPALLVAEFGHVRMEKICNASSPSPEALKFLEDARKEVAQAQEDAKKLPAAFQRVGAKLVEGMELKVRVAESQIGNPANVPEFDRKLVNLLARRLLKADMADYMAQVEFVRAHLHKLQPVGTKY